MQSLEHGCCLLPKGRQDARRAKLWHRLCLGIGSSSSQTIPTLLDVALLVSLLFTVARRLSSSYLRGLDDRRQSSPGDLFLLRQRSPIGVVETAG
jgi:hypothetical protein